MAEACVAPRQTTAQGNASTMITSSSSRVCLGAGRSRPWNCSRRSLVRDRQPADRLLERSSTLVKQPAAALEHAELVEQVALVVRSPVPDARHDASPPRPRSSDVRVLFLRGVRPTCVCSLRGHASRHPLGDGESVASAIALDRYKYL